MAFNDAFGIFGHYAFSSRPTHGRSIYETIVENQGDSYDSDFSSLQSARLYADSICLASAQYQLDRALNNRDVSKATELLTQLEKDFQVTPGQNDTLKQRRDFLVAVVKVSKGNSQGAIESALKSAIGDDFISYTHLTPTLFPEFPGSTGIFPRDGEPIKQFKIVPYIATTGTSITVPISVVEHSEYPIAGESYIVDPDPRMNIEKITIESVSGNSITTTFSRAHEPMSSATSPYPLWSSYARYSNITVSHSAVSDPEKRRKINEIMSRSARGVSQWAIVSGSGFILDDTVRGIMNANTLY